MAKKTRTANAYNYRPPDRIPEREQQWKTVEKAMSSAPGEKQSTVNVSGRRRNPR